MRVVVGEFEVSHFQCCDFEDDGVGENIRRLLMVGSIFWLHLSQNFYIFLTLIDD